MISPQELRIGNYVHHNDNWCYRQPINNFKEFDFQWDLEDFMALGECTMDDKNIFPIPLTAEWLEKLGFEKYGRWYSTGFLQVSLEGTVAIQEWITKSTPINYVHQLQNLYFALTGTELELKK